MDTNKYPNSIINNVNVPKCRAISIGIFKDWLYMIIPSIGIVSQAPETNKANTPKIKYG